MKLQISSVGVLCLAYGCKKKYIIFSGLSLQEEQYLYSDSSAVSISFRETGLYILADERTVVCGSL